jgi:ATP-dependent helicase IRC3
VDVVDNVGRANGMLVSPTLFGLTHDELAEEERERKEAKDYDGGTHSNISRIMPLTDQKLPLQRRLEKAHLEFEKSLL